MIVCGVDIKAKEANLALVQKSLEEIGHIECSTKKLTLLDDRDSKSLLTLKSAILAFALQNKVDAFVVKGRQATGPHAAGGITFKIETLFQLSGTPVVFISPQSLAAFSKSNKAGVPASVVGYQQDAYRVGACHLSKG